MDNGFLEVDLKEWESKKDFASMKAVLEVFLIVNDSTARTVKLAEDLTVPSTAYQARRTKSVPPSYSCNPQEGPVLHQEGIHPSTNREWVGLCVCDP